MSLLHLGKAWDYSDATGTTRLVLLAVAMQADQNGVCSMSYGEIAGAIRADEATVARSVSRLIEMGELQTRKPARGSAPATYAVTVAVEGLRYKPAPLPAKRPQAPKPQADEIDILIEAIEAPKKAAPAPPKPAIKDLTLNSVTPKKSPFDDLPEGFPKSAVGQILVAAGVDPNQRGPFYWLRSQHMRDLDRMQSDTGMTVEAILDRLNADPRTHPDLASIDALSDIMGWRS